MGMGAAEIYYPPGVYPPGYQPLKPEDFPPPPDDPVYDVGAKFGTEVTARAPGFPWWILLVLGGLVIVAKRS